MRVGIIGVGKVGASVAMALLTRGGVRELYLHDLQAELAAGEALDLAQGAAFLRSTVVRAAAISELGTCDAVVIAAGRNGKPGESRLALLQDNAGVVRAIGTQLRNHPGLLVMVTNPVDVLTQVLLEASGLPPARVLGTGTLLDSARMRVMLGHQLGVAAQSVHMHVMGEHGDSQVAVFSSARVGGVALRAWPSWSQSRESSLAVEVRDAASEIIKRKGATNHAIGLTTAYLLKWALGDEQRVITVSRWQEGRAGVSDVCLSLPAIVGRQGALQVLEPALDDGERVKLHESAALLRAAYASLS